MIIRRMTQEDTEHVAEIEKLCFSLPWTAQGFADGLAYPDNIFLVAEEADTIIGYIGMYVAYEEGEITNVAVEPAFRGSGVAGKLIEALLELAREQLVQRVLLEVRLSNAAAIHVYERSGFTKIGERPGFYDLPKEDALIYRIELEQNM